MPMPPTVPPPGSSPVTFLLDALGARACCVPEHVPVYVVDWSELGADSAPLERCQVAYGPAADTLAAALAGEVRAGRILWGRLADRRTGEILAEYPAP